MRSLSGLWVMLLVPVAACAQAQGGVLPSQAGGAEATAAEAATAAIRVETAPVESQPMPRYLTLRGTVVADQQSEVAANVGGQIIATFVERGQAVKKGQALAVIDSRAAGFSASAAAAQSRAAETQVSLAQQECARAEELFAQGVIAQADHDRMTTQCTAQVFSATAARANADLAHKLATDAVIRAPFDGVVGERYVNLGEYVQPMTHVVSLFAVDPVRVSISVPEPAVSQVRAGQKLNLRVAAWGERDFSATVKFVSPALRPLTRDLIVEATAPNPDGALRPGMFASVLLVVGEEEHATVPADAIKTDGAVRRLFLAKDGQAVEMVVRTGVAKDGRVAVLTPLTPGERVILKPPSGLRDGTAVE